MAKRKPVVQNRILTAYDNEAFVEDGYPERRPVPVVDFDAAVAMMAAHADAEPAVFWDFGWGESWDQLMISVILGGDGQNPIGFVTRDTYDQLLAEKVVGANQLHTFKARRWHPFLGEGADPGPSRVAGCSCPVCRKAVTS